jgi:hypothetical protein
MIRKEYTVCGASALCQGKLWKITLAQGQMIKFLGKNYLLRDA